MRGGAAVVLSGGPGLGKTWITEWVRGELPELPIHDDAVNLPEGSGPWLAAGLPTLGEAARARAGLLRFPLQVLTPPEARSAVDDETLAETCGGHPALLDAALRGEPLEPIADRIFVGAWVCLDEDARRLARALLRAGRPLSVRELRGEVTLPDFKRSADLLVNSGLAGRHIDLDLAVLDASAEQVQAWWRKKI